LIKRNWKEDNLELDRQERAVPLLQCSVQRKRNATQDSAAQRSGQVEYAQSRATNLPTYGGLTVRRRLEQVLTAAQIIKPGLFTEVRKVHARPLDQEGSNHYLALARIMSGIYQGQYWVVASIHSNTYHYR
jgi:hypothetical protein